jgi:hypothetical protein
MSQACATFFHSLSVLIRSIISTPRFTRASFSVISQAATVTATAKFFFSLVSIAFGVWVIYSSIMGL